MRSKYELKVTKHCTSNLSSPPVNILVEVPSISGLSVKYIILTQYLLLTLPILVVSKNEIEAFLLAHCKDGFYSTQSEQRGERPFLECLL